MQFLYSMTVQFNKICFTLSYFLYTIFCTISSLPICKPFWKLLNLLSQKGFDKDTRQISIILGISLCPIILFS